MKTEKFYDENGKLIKERIYERTPSGGAYSEMCYVDDSHVVIRECEADGTLISETWGAK